MDAAARGAAAMSQSDYDGAVKEYTAAIAVNPTAVKYYIQRSTAYQRSQKYSDALADAEIAVGLAHKRASRELIKDAQLRRAIGLYFMDRPADADFVLNLVKRLDPKEKSLQIWHMKVANKLKELDEGDERAKVTAKEVPDMELPSLSSPKPAAKQTEDSEEKKVEEPAPTAPKPVAPTPANKIKHDWYQNNETVTLNLLAKGVPKDKATVDITKDTLSIAFPVGESASDFEYTVDPFYAEVDPETSSYRITATKVEVTLKKAVPGNRWKTLEGDRETSSPSENKGPIPSHVLASKTNEQPPAYPTSSRKGVTNWDKVASDLTKKKPKGDDDEGGDDYAMDEFDGDETTRFFKHLYKGATPDQQRAMMKSFQESGGTVLSTDWNQVGSKTVKPEPPDGMEAKSY